jgi:predicted RNA-binding protein
VIRSQVNQGELAMEDFQYNTRKSDNLLLLEISTSLREIVGLLQKQIDSAEATKRASEPSLGLEGIPLFSSTKKSSGNKKKTAKKAVKKKK